MSKRKRGRLNECREKLDPLSRAILKQGDANTTKSAFPETIISQPPTVATAQPAEETKSSIPDILSLFYTLESTTSQKPSEAVMIIPRLQTKPERIIIIKDLDKSTLGFPFGGVETEKGKNGIIDKDRPQACRRETLEEIFGIPETEFSEDKAAKLGVVVTEDDYIGRIEKAANHTLYIYSPVLPARCRHLLKPGSEQEAMLKVEPWKIDNFIERGIFLEYHAMGWEMCKRHFNIRV